MSTKNRFPPGWDEERVRKVIEHYDAQTEEEALAEDEAMLEAEGQTLVMVPVELMPAICELLAKYEREKDREAR